ncbi:hypothetical protein KEM54_005154 [Ascosphaera aggregata]|nr:hypothetical protein KEM54_005154 [Ascosphaera aggregata]
MFSGTKLQILTYLFGVCLFSIAFLVFLNASIPFVITDLFGLRHGLGDAIGTLGFADEVLALIACPIWGLLSDRIGLRCVCVAGYAIIALSLALFVQARNVYPQLLLSRLLFSLGGSAVTTMVTAILPCVATPVRDKKQIATIPGGASSHQTARAPSTESYHTAERGGNRDEEDEELLVIDDDSSMQVNPTSLLGYRKHGGASKLAGLVGSLTGCGAVLALLFLLPLPAHFEKSGLSAPVSVKRSFYIVAAVASAISILCLIGLEGLGGEKPGNWKAAFRRFGQPRVDTVESLETDGNLRSCPASYWSQFKSSLALSFTCANLGLAYIGGFVARASSVGISLFIPLYVNQYYRRAGLCGGNEYTDLNASSGGADGIKQSCPQAYINASILTGVSQLVALCAAPLFGYLSSRSHRHNLPLLLACLSGIIGYPLFALLTTPQVEGNTLVFVSMILIGISQIGAIVCSLGLLGDEVMRQTSSTADVTTSTPPGENEDSSLRSQERVGLLSGRSLSNEGRHDYDLARFKGSIAGIYSLSGGAGILVLTKVGGFLSDKLHPAVPFYILAGFNGLLLLSGLLVSLHRLLEN